MHSVQSLLEQPTPAIALPLLLLGFVIHRPPNPAKIGKTRDGGYITRTVIRLILKHERLFIILALSENLTTPPFFKPPALSAEPPETDVGHRHALASAESSRFG